jgi:hypothetical protein
MAKPYTNQTMVLVITINTIHILRSPTLLDFQDLYTWGMNVMEVRKDPKYPINSTHWAGKLKIKFIIRLIKGFIL